MDKYSQSGRVLVVTKKDRRESNTNYAQGGIAAVLEKTDSFEDHIEDTSKAGCFHNDKEIVANRSGGRLGNNCAFSGRQNTTSAD